MTNVSGGLLKMIRPNIIDSELIELYNTDTPIKDIMAHFGTSHSTLYRHIGKVNEKLNRKRYASWTDKEESQLVAARNAGVTGRELCDYIPTRTLASIKGHIVKMRRESGGEFR